MKRSETDTMINMLVQIKYVNQFLEAIFCGFLWVPISQLELQYNEKFLQQFLTIYICMYFRKCSVLPMQLTDTKLTFVLH